MWAYGSLSCQVWTEATDSQGREKLGSGPVMLGGIRGRSSSPSYSGCSSDMSAIRHLTTQALVFSKLILAHNINLYFPYQ